MSDYGADSDPQLNKIRTVAFQYNFANQVNLKVDQFSTVDTKKCYHLVKRIGSTNLHFLVEPTDVPG